MKGTYSHHDVHGQPEDRGWVVHPQRHDVHQSEERVWEHRLDDERDDARVCLRRLMPECLPRTPRDVEDADADEHRAREVEDDNHGGIGERDECSRTSEEIGIRGPRGVAG